jgi:hypothetical protein
VGKFIVLLAALFTLAIVSPIGKIFTDVVTENYTFASFSTFGNLSNVAWYVAYMRSYWWVMPLAFIAIFFVQFMKKDEPEPYTPQMLSQPRMPRQPKQPKTRKTPQQQPKPPIFFGR